MRVKISKIKELLSSGKKVRIKSVDGRFVSVGKYIEKGIKDTYCVLLQNGLSIKVSNHHKFFSNSGWLETRHLIPGETKLLCDDGNYYVVKNVLYVGKHKIVDVTVDDMDHCYFGNGILNHNSGKSYIAMQIASNALKEDVDVVYFDTEAAVDPDFTKKILDKNGFTLNDFLYVMPDSLELVLESIENILANSTKSTLFILDSLANCPTRNSLEQEFTPGASIGEVARMLSIAFKKLTVPLSNHESTFLIINQLKTNIKPANPGEIYTDPFVTPGGKALLYMASLRIWLTLEKGKKHFVYDDVTGERMGSEIVCMIKKSRFGTMGREVETKFLWSGEDLCFQEDEAMLEIIKKSDAVNQAGAWTTMKYEDGSEEKFQGASYLERMKSDPKFKSRVLQLVDSVLLR